MRLGNENEYLSVYEFTTMADADVYRTPTSSPRKPNPKTPSGQGTDKDSVTPSGQGTDKDKNKVSPDSVAGVFEEAASSGDETPQKPANSPSLPTLEDFSNALNRLLPSLDNVFDNFPKTLNIQGQNEDLSKIYTVMYNYIMSLENKKVNPEKLFIHVRDTLGIAPEKANIGHFAYFIGLDDLDDQVNTVFDISKQIAQVIKASYPDTRVYDAITSEDFDREGFSTLLLSYFVPDGEEMQKVKTDLNEMVKNEIQDEKIKELLSLAGFGGGYDVSRSALDPSKVKMFENIINIVANVAPLYSGNIQIRRFMVVILIIMAALFCLGENRELLKTTGRVLFIETNYTLKTPNRAITNVNSNVTKLISDEINFKSQLDIKIIITKSVDDAVDKINTLGEFTPKEKTNIVKAWEEVTDKDKKNIVNTIQNFIETYKTDNEATKNLELSFITKLTTKLNELGISKDGTELTYPVKEIYKNIRQSYTYQTTIMQQDYGTRILNFLFQSFYANAPAVYEQDEYNVLKRIGLNSLFKNGFLVKSNVIGLNDTFTLKKIEMNKLKEVKLNTAIQFFQNIGDNVAVANQYMILPSSQYKQVLTVILYYLRLFTIQKISDLVFYTDNYKSLGYIVALTPILMTIPGMNGRSMWTTITKLGLSKTGFVGMATVGTGAGVVRALDLFGPLLKRFIKNNMKQSKKGLTFSFKNKEKEFVSNTDPKNIEEYTPFVGYRNQYLKTKRSSEKAIVLDEGENQYDKYFTSSRQRRKCLVFEKSVDGISISIQRKIVYNRSFPLDWNKQIKNFANILNFFIVNEANIRYGVLQNIDPSVLRLFLYSNTTIPLALKTYFQYFMEECSETDFLKNIVTNPLDNLGTIYNFGIGFFHYLTTQEYVSDNRDIKIQDIKEEDYEKCLSKFDRENALVTLLIKKALFSVKKIKVQMENDLDKVGLDLDLTFMESDEDNMVKLAVSIIVMASQTLRWGLGIEYNVNSDRYTITGSITRPKIQSFEKLRYIRSKSTRVSENTPCYINSFPFICSSQNPNMKYLHKCNTAIEFNDFGFIQNNNGIRVYYFKTESIQNKGITCFFTSKQEFTTVYDYDISNKITTENTFVSEDGVAALLQRGSFKYVKKDQGVLVTFLKKFRNDPTNIFSSNSNAYLPRQEPFPMGVDIDEKTVNNVNVTILKNYVRSLDTATLVGDLVTLNNKMKLNQRNELQFFVDIYKECVSQERKPFQNTYGFDQNMYRTLLNCIKTGIDVDDYKRLFDTREKNVMVLNESVQNKNAYLNVEY